MNILKQSCRLVLVHFVWVSTVKGPTLTEVRRFCNYAYFWRFQDRTGLSRSPTCQTASATRTTKAFSTKKLQATELGKPTQNPQLGTLECVPQQRWIRKTWQVNLGMRVSVGQPAHHRNELESMTVRTVSIDSAMVVVIVVIVFASGVIKTRGSDIRPL